MHAPANPSDISAAGIAIIGMGCLFPGGINSPEALWQFLSEGRDAIIEVPPDRWNVDQVYDPDARVPGKSITRWGGFVPDIQEFDPSFFGISPREAAMMDPQQRMLLETAWRALEDAGIRLDRIAGSRTGVYVGISHSDYHEIQKFGRFEIDVHTSTGGALSIAANRLSHRFDLRGPSLAVDTACSSSLVALDLACASLRSGECEMALVGGVNAILTPDVTITFSRASMLSPDGRCKAFDARANGYVRGEGAGVVVLKPALRAIADGDRICAIIRSTAVNQDGRTTTITVPNVQAQIDMLREACRRGVIDPAHVGYVEAHGTGTPVGDPIEAQAIGTVFGRGGEVEVKDRCRFGSIKSNIGHLEPASGMAGLIKAALCVQRGYIPPTLHIENVNPRIREDEWGIQLSREGGAFPDSPGPRLAAVNSFGFGGTNACVILQEPPKLLRERQDRNLACRPALLPLSGSSNASLCTIAGRIADQVDAGDIALADLAGTLALRSTHLDYRAVVLADSSDEASSGLRSLAEGKQHDRVIVGRRMNCSGPVFAFTGQGAQWWGMGRELFRHDAVFRSAFQDCDSIFTALSGNSLTQEFDRPEKESRIDQTDIAQPMTFALQVGLAARWRAWGIEPAAVVGHSIGEMAAAYVAGALTLDSAVNVVYHRSRLQERARFQGGMVAVGLAPEATRKLLVDEKLALEIAAINGSDLVTVAGERAELDRLMTLLAANRTFGRALRVDYAFHSRQMDAFESELRRSLEGVVSHQPSIPMFSTVTGEAVRPGELDGDYWWRNMRQTVLFSAAVDVAIDAGFNTFVELGARSVLSGPIRSRLSERNVPGAVVASLQRDTDEVTSLAGALAEAYVAGLAPDWNKVVAPGWHFVRLPPQPFEKIPCWAESEESRSARLDQPSHPLLGMKLKTVAPRWQNHVSALTPAFLADHRVDGSVVFPAAGYIELMLAAAREELEEPPWELEGLSFHEALVLGIETMVLIETSIDLDSGKVMVASRTRGGDGAWTRRASAKLRSWRGPQPELDKWQPKIEPPAHIGKERFYRALRTDGHDFGPAFRGIQSVWHEQGEVLGLVAPPPEAGRRDGYLFHPAVLDACFHVIRGFKSIISEDSDAVLALPFAVGRIVFFRAPGEALLSRATAIIETPTEIVADISILNDAGDVVALIQGLRCHRVQRMRKQDAALSSLYQEEWIKLPDLDTAKSALRERCAGKKWLLLADRGGVAEAIASQIRFHGGEASLFYAGAEFKRVGDWAFEASADVTGLQHALEQIGDVDEIVHLWLLDHTKGPGARQIETSRELGVETPIFLVQALARLGLRPRVSIATAGSVLLKNDATPDQFTLAQAAIIGAARSIRNEHPDLGFRLLDLGAADVSTRLSGESLLNELVCEAGETEIALRGLQRFGCRLARKDLNSFAFSRKPWSPATHMPPFQLTMKAPGQIDHLTLRERPLPPLGHEDVLIEVRAAGLNFRDVMAATGLLPAEAEDEPAWQNLGLECSGIVRGVGEGVDPHLVGRRVAAVTRGSLASHVRAAASLVFEIPDTLSFAQAAAVPTVYITAHYALKTLGRMQRDDHVLIHAAAGGVGLAAVAIAQKTGAKIFATAGSPEKREYLRCRGVEHVFDSRSLSFADELMKITGGRGVDLVLNSLPGPFLHKSLSVLAPGGRFLEIGKRDIYADTLVGLRGFRENIAFFAIDLARLSVADPGRIRREFESVLGGLADGELALLPIAEFGLGEVVDAFRHMARGKHIGKIVISFDQGADVERNGLAIPTIRADATYLITGGLGGLGLATARWLADRGARSLALIGRSGPSGGVLETIAELRSRGVEVSVFAADVRDRDQLADCFAQIEATARPLRGIFHAAGVIDDALTVDLDGDHIQRVFNPKVIGAWHLHDLSANIPLDFFVCYSSIAATIGSVGQAHYAAANAVLDALVNFRRTLHLPALAIAWGPISDAGFLTRRADVAHYLGQIGLEPIPVQRGLDTLGDLIIRDCGAVVFADVRWAQLARSASEAGRPRLAELRTTNQELDQRHGSLRSRLLAAPAVEREAMVAQFVREQIGAVLKVSPQSVDLDRPLNEAGLDSLTSFELKNRVETGLGIAIPISRFLQQPRASDLIEAICDKLEQPEQDELQSVSVDGLDSSPDMSIGQEALWLAEQLDRGSPAYGLAMCVAVRPRLDPELIDIALQRIVARHDSLRMSFPADALGPLPTFLDVAAFRLIYHDATSLEEIAFRDQLDREANRPFDLSRDPLLRLHLYRRPESDVILLHVHHIIADAASIVICVEEMFQVYFAVRQGVPVAWARPALLIANFAKWQKAMVNGRSADAHKEFWRTQLAGAPAGINLPTDFPRPPDQRGPGSSRTMLFPRELGRALKRLASQEGQTLFTVLLTAFDILLHGLSGESDVVIGIPAHGRVRPEFADAVGYFVNPVPIRIGITPAETGKSLIVSVGQAVRAALEHQELPFARVVRELNVPRESSRAPIFQIMFSMERPAEIDVHGFASTLLNTEGASIEIRDFKIESLAVKRDRAQFDLAFVMEEFDDQILGVIDYRKDLWELASIERMAAQYMEILGRLAALPHQPVSQLLAEQETSALRGDVLPQVPDVMQVIHRAAARSPERVAVEWSDGCYSYSQLLDRIDAIRAVLETTAVPRPSIIGIASNRSGDLVAALLAVIDFGATYVPLDAKYPPARLSRTLADAAPALLIADRENSVVLETIANCPVVVLDTLDRAPLVHGARSDSGDVHSSANGRSDLAYIIHTSGSTSGPVGVEVGRDALSNFLSAMARELPLSEKDVLLAVTTVGFDIAAMELLLPLTLGGRVVIADDATARNAELLRQRLDRQDITAMQATPATWRMLIDAGWEGNAQFKAFVGGERLQRQLADELLARAGGGLWNLYGPTETTIWSTCTRVSASTNDVPIGRPIANTTCYVVDDALNLVPPGAVGELVIGGMGVARGYHNQPDLTATRFVPDPTDLAGQGRCFRTGDFVRVTRDGLAYIGRRDEQVKVRGFRVELGEIETVLTSHPAVLEAAAVVQGGDLENIRLVAFVALDQHVPLASGELKGHLEAQLPGYMVPAITIVPQLPRLPNGKLDKRALKIAAVPGSNAGGAGAGNEIETKLLSLLEEILDGSVQVSRTDDFFSLGGTSLAAMRYLARIGETLHVTLGVSDLMRATTVAAMADLIADKLTGVAEKVSSETTLSVGGNFWRPLALARAERRFGDVDAAAIAYIPNEAAQLLELRTGRATALHAAPHWLGLCRVASRTIALVVAPVTERDMFSDANVARSVIEESIAFSARLGVRCVALTGLVPAATDFGRALTAPDNLAVTTGHAATASSIGLTVQAVARACGRALRHETMCFVGLGAIGTAALQTILARLEHPRALILCDVPAKRERLEELARTVKAEYGFRGTIEIATSRASVSERAYQAGVFVGSTNMPGVIEVDKLRPGSIIVDDSFPFCFDYAAARRRFDLKADILCLSGGSVRPAGMLDWSFAALPEIRATSGEMISFLPNNDMITGCIFSALLPSLAGVTPTLGPVSLQDCMTYWDAFERIGVTAPVLHCGTWRPTAADLRRFSQQYSAPSEPAQVSLPV